MNNLYTQNDKENKDILTKSNILAPFSSSIINENDISSNLCNELDIKNDIIEFNENVNILNRQYELNNNGEIDHGILINHSSSLKEKNIEEEIYDNNYKFSIENNNIKNNISAPENKKFIKYCKEDSQRNISSLTNSSTIDENVIKIMEGMGYKRDYIQKALFNNDFNYATATFFLLSNNINDLE